ncbi:MAG TPA: cyclodeaminase/cyclohydrolase family protein [Candidatus Omnitrophota bacterium]|nr:cyclodeaminase/cyclohydrolase family protein [Candidatus Omnitrophota bacterium]HOX09720.1 cyclodeaminase/cyclohydrolase family protein [Candidatus Omnitrophota bacterium]HPN66544.1 cyclodeaminase/cyclohydrolase family protein [Candidatus Omnitrophota bacterium]HRZ67421.1 cyclodeaminase/cyclohydrolase family protein [Candidatus Omnitrophota bacterium]
MKISDRNNICSFMKALGRKKPVPGGGAAAALAGALGAALLMKVANFTIGKKKYRIYEKDAKTILGKAGTLMKRLSSYIEKDARAYDEYARTRSAASMRKATLCVSEIAKMSSAALTLCPRLRKIGNRNLKGDLYAAEALLKASAQSAGNLVKLNRKRTGR